jgi:hypothetical protein
MGTRAIKSIIVAALGVLALAACTSGHENGKSSPQPSQPSSSSTSKAGSKPAQSGGAEAPTSTSQVGICKIADPSDVANAYGGKVGTVAGGTTPIGSTKCLFTLTKSNTGVPGTVALTLNSSSSAAAFARVKKQAAGATTVADVGERAFYQAATSTLQFVKGRSVVAIQADIRVPGEKPANPPKVRADTVALAKTVAAQL